MKVGELFAELRIDTSKFDIALQQSRQNAESFGSSLTGVLGSAASVMTGALTAGAVVAGGALIGAGAAGFQFNAAMESARLQINAFTKDAAKTEEILQMIKTRAAETPFSFQEMTTAAASLIPAANAAGSNLEELIELAEILAASNPAQGLEGAAVALREAMSGDFVSLIERFNIPRTEINKLKEEGLPALEIVRQSLQSLGLDAELVANMAQTMSGRWGKITDTLQNLAGVATQPLFDILSASLGQLADWLEQNEPMLRQMAETIGTQLAGAVQIAGPIILSIFSNIQSAISAVQPLFASFSNAISQNSGTITSIISTLAGSFIDRFNRISETVKNVISGIVSVAQAFLPIFETFWRENGSRIVDFITNAWSKIQTITANVFTIVNTIIVNVFSAIASFIENNGDTILEIISRIWNALETIIAGSLRAVEGITEAILAALSGDWGTALNEILGVVTTIGSTIVNTLGEIFFGGTEEAAAFFAKIPERIAEFLNDALEFVQNIGSEIIEKAKSIGASVFEGITGSLAGIGSELSNQISNSIANTLSGNVSSIFGSFPLFQPQPQTAITVNAEYRGGGESLFNDISLIRELFR